MTKHVQRRTRSAKQTCLIGIAILVLAGICLSQTATSSSPGDWTEFHRDNMQRWNPYETVLGVNNVGSLVRKWSYATGVEVDSLPTVANGVVYVGSADNKLHALNATTGALLRRKASHPALSGQGRCC
jgi:glucose dehydrogenase